MTRTFRFALALGVTMGVGAPALAQQTQSVTPPTTVAASGDKATKSQTPDQEQTASRGRKINLQYFRAQDQRGLNVFETSKNPGAEYEGFKVDWGAAFTTQLQDLSHSNTATAVMVNGVDSNKLADIGFGFNNSTANLYLHGQLAKGMRVQLSMYLSARRHNETWVKDGYLQMDESPIEFPPLQALMQYLTIKVGHMEINYGDAHFRRSDNGNALYNPFVGNYILDAFTTEVSGEVYLKAKNVIAMGAVTAGELRSSVLNPGKRSPTFIGKLGYDTQVNEALRVRLTGSMYRTTKSASNTLYSGDRAGSRFYFVLENTAATETAQAVSGLYNPRFSNEVTAVQVNPFVKLRGLELFGVIERAEGRASTEPSDRVWNQYAVDAVYRFLPREQLFAGVRYNVASGDVLNVAGKPEISRWEVGGGWFITPSVLMKAEYVNQQYKGFPATNILNGGKFKGLMLEGVIGF